MDNSATLHLLSGPKQPRNVRGTHQVFHKQPNASCSLAPGNGPKCHLRPETCQSKRTSASSRRTPPHKTSFSKAFSMTSQILTHPKELSGRARRISKCAFDSYVPRSIAPQDRHGTAPHQSREELLRQTPSARMSGSVSALTGTFDPPFIDTSHLRCAGTSQLEMRLLLVKQRDLQFE